VAGGCCPSVGAAKKNGAAIAQSAIA